MQGEFETSFQDFDHNEPAHRDGVEPVWAEMRAIDGVPRSDRHGGFHVVTRYQDVSTVTRNSRLFSSAGGIAIPNVHFGTPMLPIECDPPMQGAIRKFLLPLLTRSAVTRHADFARDLAVQLIDAVRGERQIDFAAAFALPYPSGIALNFLGFPGEDATHLDYLINTAIDGRGNQKSAKAAADLDAYLLRFLKDWGAKPVEDDNVVSVIAHADLPDHDLTEAERLSITRLILFGGFTTTTFALTAGMRWLAEHPEDWRRMREEPQLITTAIDEIVRFASPGTYLGRTVTADTELGGTRLSAGDRVLVSYGSANRDPSMFDQPERLKLDRVANPHMGFGHGTHACIGLHLARLELRIALEELIRHIESIRLGDADGITWSSGETQGMTTLPMFVEWDEKARRR